VGKTGFLRPEDRPDALVMIPPPPPAGSSRLAADVELYRESLRWRDTPRWRLATSDADVQFPHAADIFSCAAGIRIAESTTPHLYSLLQRVIVDAGKSTAAAKKKYDRARPFALYGHSTCVPNDEAILKTNGGYPSGHSSLGWAWALVLAELIPQRADAILSRGYEFGQSRVICGVHWQTDVDAGRMIASCCRGQIACERGIPGQPPRRQQGNRSRADRAGSRMRSGSCRPCEQGAARRDGRHRLRRGNLEMNPEEAERLAAQLDAHPDYRVLRRLQPDAATHLASKFIRCAAVVDTETTGTDPATDKVIELAIVTFEYCAASGTIGRVTGRYDAFEDPGMAIPPESTAIHGITDEMVSGKRFDDAAIGALLAGVGLVVAHNARFDRGFLEPRLPVFGTLPWSCSWQEVPWHEAGLGSSKLEYLAYRHGFFYEGHRAEADCLALLEVLRRPFAQTGKPAFARMLDSARKPSFGCGPTILRSRRRTLCAGAASAGRRRSGAGIATCRVQRACRPKLHG
jgi:DNA polymerase III epsilon subunit-like protein